MAGANSNARSIQHCCHVMRMHTVQIKCHKPRSGFTWTWPVYRDALDFRQTLNGEISKVRVVLRNFLHADVAQVVDRGAQTDGTCDDGSAAFELPRRLFPSRLV